MTLGAEAPQYSLERPLEGLPAPAPRDAEFRRGVTLELVLGEGEGEAQRAAYRTWLDHAARLGATDLELVVRWSQLDAASVEMAPHTSTTVADDLLGWIMDQAAARNLRVLLTPVIEVERAAGARAVAPADHKRWFWSYHRFVLHYARIAAAHGACCFGVGSDLPALDGADDAAHWRELIADVRKAFKGKLAYGARFDRLEHVSFWDALELVNVLGAGELSEGSAQQADPKLASLAERLRAFRKAHALPLLLTQTVLAGGDERARLDAARALYRGMQAEPQLAGVYVSFVGPPKPAPAGAAAEVLRHWYARSPN